MSHSTEESHDTARGLQRCDDSPLYVISFVAASSAATIDKSGDSIILESQGIVLSPKNYIISGSSKIFASIFIRVNKPLINSTAQSTLCMNSECDLDQTLLRKK